MAIRRTNPIRVAFLIPITVPNFSASTFSNNYRENQVVSRTFSIDWGNAPASGRTLTATESSPYITNVVISSNQVTVTLDLSNIVGNQTATVNLTATNSAGSGTAIWNIAIAEAGAMWASMNYGHGYYDNDGIKIISLSSITSGDPSPTYAFVGISPSGVSITGTNLLVDTAIYDGGEFMIRATNENGSDDADWTIDIFAIPFALSEITPTIGANSLAGGTFFNNEYFIVFDPDSSGTSTIVIYNEDTDTTTTITGVDLGWLADSGSQGITNTALGMGVANNVIYFLRLTTYTDGTDDVYTLYRINTFGSVLGTTDISSLVSIYTDIYDGFGVKYESPDIVAAFINEEITVVLTKNFSTAAGDIRGGSSELNLETDEVVYNLCFVDNGDLLLLIGDGDALLGSTVYGNRFSINANLEMSYVRTEFSYENPGYYPNGPMFYNPTAGRVYFLDGAGGFISYEV